MGETGFPASGPQHSPGVQHGDVYNSLGAVSRALAAAAASPAPAEEDTCPVPLILSRSASDAVDSAVAVLAEASRGSMSLETSCERGACCSSLTDRAASAEMKAIASGNAADMVAMLTAHRQIATGDTEPACEIRQNLRACSGVLGSAAKSACEASAKAGPIGGLAWQIAVLDAMPLGPSALDYNFTARGHLPEVWLVCWLWHTFIHTQKPVLWHVTDSVVRLLMLARHPHPAHYHSTVHSRAWDFLFP